MKNKAILFLTLFICSLTQAQKVMKSDLLYSDQSPMEIKLNYSNKNVKKNTTDSTFIETDLNFLHQGKWNIIPPHPSFCGNPHHVVLYTSPNPILYCC